MKRIISGISALLLVLVMIFSSISAAAVSEPIKPDQPATLTVVLKSGSTVISGAELSLYRVADISEAAQFTLCGDFKDFDGKINGLNGAKEWDKLASTLKSYVDKNSIGSFKSGKTDSNGKFVFKSGDDKLLPGLYMLTCKGTTINKKYYTANPCLISLPNSVDGEDSWNYNVTVYPKTGVKDKPTPPTPPDVPQTGMLWWPVPVLISVGLLLVAIGSFCRRREHEA